MLELNCHTIKEINHQPQMWMDTYDIVLSHKAEIEKFVADNNLTKDTRIILTGAGTSAFTADAAECVFTKAGFAGAKAVATTDIVSAPESFLDPDDRLFISFARSGNSPESVAAYNIARKYCKDALHLIITCNPEGKLAKGADPSKDIVIVLPDGTNDRSLAMTSSFSSMLVACILCVDIVNIDKHKAELEAAAGFAARFLKDDVVENIKAIAAKDIKRAVFLGSGVLKGISCECHLKLQELTDGQVMCSFDSFMGLRHGPKAVINEETLVVYLLSEQPYTKQYELDLIDQVDKENKPAAQVIVSTVPSGVKGCKIDFEVNADKDIENLVKGDFKFVPYVLIGQLFGYFFSRAHGLDPDAPSVRGTISRVVKGVTIYEY